MRISKIASEKKKHELRNFIKSIEDEDKEINKKKRRSKDKIVELSEVKKWIMKKMAEIKDIELEYKTVLRGNPSTRKTVFTQRQIINLMLIDKDYLENIKLGYTHNKHNPNNSRLFRRIKNFESEGYESDPLLNRRIAVNLDNEEGKEEVEEEKNNKDIDKILEQLITIG